jgi:hypothetical protein
MNRKFRHLTIYLTLQLFTSYSYCQEVVDSTYDNESKNNKFEHQFTYSSDFGLNFSSKNESFANARKNSMNFSDDPVYLKIQSSVDYNAKSNNFLQYHLNYGFLISSQSSRNYERILENNGISDDQLHQEGNQASIRAYPHICQITFTSKNGLFLESGLINMNYGNSMLINPVNYLQRYITNPEDRMRFNEPNPGAFSFPATAIGFISSNHSFTLGAIPQISKSNNRFVREWIYAKDHNNIVYLLTNHSILNTKISTSTFINQVKKNALSKSDIAFGVETDAHLFSIGTVSSQSIITKGVTRLVSDPQNPTKCVLDSNSVAVKAMISATINLPFALSSITGGYYFNGAGYTKSEVNWFSANLDNGIKSNDPLWLKAISTFSAIDFRKHYLFATFSLPAYSDYIDFSLVGMYCISDRSAMLYAQNNFTLSDAIVLSLRDNLFLGGPTTAFGFTPYKNTFSILGSINF